tara:strand:+ start:16724 stop:17848 length:1125 start_codon:yes stop_codon:yes gene_type:complete
MGFGLSSFGFQESGSGGGGGTNTNIANTNLTQDAARILTGGSNKLTFTGQSEVETNSVFSFKNGSSAPDIRIYEASGSGTNYVKLTVGALAANRTLTMPDATGTIALTSDINSYTAGDGITLNTLEFDLDAIQTIITSITNAALKIGRDSQNLIDFATTDNKIIFRVNNVNEVELSANNFSPVTDDGCALGTSSLQWSDLFLNAAAVIDFDNGGATISQTSSNQLNITTSDPSRGTNLTHRNFKTSSTTDGNVKDGDVVNFGTGTVVAGQCYYYTSAGAWALADRRTEAASIGFLGVAMASGTASTVGMCIRGMVTMSTDVGDVGDVLWLRINGAFENAIPTSSGEYVRVMGYCLDDANGQIFFNPSQDWTEIA